MKANKHLQIYKEYINRPKNVTVETLAKKHALTKAGLYYIVKKVEHGDTAKINRCTEQSRQMCLWEHKYKKRYQAIPKGRSAESVKQLKRLILDMRNDKFNTPTMASLLKRDRTTILHHLSNEA